MVGCLTVIGGIGYILLATAKSVGGRYTGVFFAAAGIFPAIANILPWVLSKFIPYNAYFALADPSKSASKN